MKTEKPVNPFEVSHSSSNASGNRDAAGDRDPSGNRYRLDDGVTEVSFRLTRGSLRHATDHLLLHRHPLRLSIGSMLMIVASGWAIFWASSQGIVGFLAVSAFSMGLSTTIYLSLIHRSQSIMRQRLEALGMVRDVICVVRIDGEDLVLISPNGEHRWPIVDVRSYRTPFGLLFCPEPMTPIYIPRKNHSPEQSLKELRRRVVECH